METNVDAIKTSLIFLEESIQELKHKMDEMMIIQSGKQNQVSKKYVSEGEAQALLLKKTTSLWKLRKAGKLTVKKIGKTNYYSMESINKLLESDDE